MVFSVLVLPLGSGYARLAFHMGRYVLWPFGKFVVNNVRVALFFFFFLKGVV